MKDPMGNVTYSPPNSIIVGRIGRAFPSDESREQLAQLILSELGKFLGYSPPSLLGRLIA
jgi:hypothetical protein